MNRHLHPTQGARFLLERDRDDGDHATYRVSIFTPDAVFATTATLRDDGTIAVDPTGAPGEHVEMLVNLIKLTARAAAKRRGDQLPVWPARILRWRR